METRHTRESASELQSWRASDVLSDTTKARVRGLLSEALEDIGHLDRRIIAAQEDLRDLDLPDLESQKDTDMARIVILREAISPIKRVPTETLHEIFSHCTTGKIILPLRAQAAHPWLLGHVCSRWKDTIWGVPSLWSHIEIGIDRGGPEDRIVREPLSDIVAKSNVLLNLYTEGDKTAAFFDIIISFNNRVRSLAFPIVGNKDLYRFLKLPTHSFANLEELLISVLEVVPPLTMFQTTFFKNTPKLRVFKLHAQQNIPIFEPLLLPFHQLTDLGMTDFEISCNTMYSILRQATGLVFCHLKISSEPPPTANVSPIIVPSLILLNLILASSRPCDDLFGPLIFPSLLELRIVSDWTPFPLQTIMSFLHRSQCELQTLAINPEFRDSIVELSGQEIETLFRQTPSLVLCDTGFITPPSIFRMIQDGTLLPNISFGSWRFHPNGMITFLDFVDSCIPESESNQAVRVLQMDIGCYRGAEFGVVRQRFQSCKAEYRLRGIHLKSTTLPLGPLRDDDSWMMWDYFNDDVW